MEESIPPSAIQPVSHGRWISTEAWPSIQVKEKQLYLTHGKLHNAPQQEDEKVLLNTPQNHGLLAGEWMGAGVPGESPADQRIDDGMAMVFEGEVLTEAVEIFGYPRFEVELESDKPAAMLFAQLSDVAPNGAVTRVSYGVMNLTHLEGHDKVVPLVPGKKVRAFVKLDCIAHHFKPGHRLRLSLATTFWPMFWPMPEDATLTLELKSARLLLPLYKEEAPCKGPNMQPESAPPTPITLLAEGHVDRSLHYDIVKDTWTCITDGVGGVFGEGIYRFDDIDVTVEHNLKRELILTNGDPLSARYNLYQKMKLGREGWWTQADIVVSMSGDATHFNVKADMDVYENDKPVLNRKWDEKILRSGL